MDQSCARSEALELERVQHLVGQDNLQPALSLAAAGDQVDGVSPRQIHAAYVGAGFDTAPEGSGPSGTAPSN